jgi:benzoyl-CoA reductase/2-hydroxyglutaryl-CoA dehydratase subunit BcrC/BadD/HgdB
VALAAAASNPNRSDASTPPAMIEHLAAKLPSAKEALSHTQWARLVYVRDYLPRAVESLVAAIKKAAEAGESFISLRVRITSRWTVTDNVGVVKQNEDFPFACDISLPETHTPKLFFESLSKVFERSNTKRKAGEQIYTIALYTKPYDHIDIRWDLAEGATLPNC